MPNPSDNVYCVILIKCGEVGANIKDIVTKLTQIIKSAISDFTLSGIAQEIKLIISYVYFISVVVIIQISFYSWIAVTVIEIWYTSGSNSLARTGMCF